MVGNPPNPRTPEPPEPLNPRIPAMIEIECDNCERTFSVGPEKAGGKMPCPHCGDVNRVPAQQPETSDRPTAGGPETEKCHLPPAIWRAHP